MQDLTRVTGATLDVIECLLDTSEVTWGLVIMKRSGRPAGTVYPILDRLERLGWVESEWDDATERPGPRRRLYRLTADGVAAASRLIAGRVRRASSRAARVSEAGA
jgi:PadR family transcriptional regulator, regulatory protein PadR